jgi:outer membrane murein-binding lipoprotein Lpp
MTGRDRIVIVVLAALAVVAAAWLLVLSPEREKASKVNTEVSTAQAQLATAESEVNAARSAEAGYPAAYTSVVSLGKAVPTGQEVPSLIFQLEQASDRRGVEFSSITSSGGTGGSSSSSSSSGSSAAPAAVSAGFTQMPFTFVFSGSFFDLYKLFQQINHFTVLTGSGKVQVSGRLLTVQAVQLAPEASGSEKASGRLTGTITATAYVLPASQSVTGSATATSPTGAQSTSGSAASSPATTPAVIGAGR